MFITTFYSFKGGVGRSMALANVAVELAKRGRRVLAVDFDLEAPGLDTFDILRPADDVPGIIDFVHDFLETDKAPDVRPFLFRLPTVGEREGELWIMPSGAQRATYAAHFNYIDWAELYEKRDGYLLFEDLKAQWERAIDPDYVLIDSRTGHTDIGGICTRQLPDAVAILFFPNEQNLRGLTKVVQDIRAEASGPRVKEIDLHFVMSNVPDVVQRQRAHCGDCTAATRLLGREGRDIVDMDIQDAFNYGMAIWGGTGEVETGLFARVVELHTEDAGRDDANYCQCMAIANWAVGDETMGLEFVQRAQRAVDADRSREFSCWRYYRVPVEEFRRDLNEIAALIQGDGSKRPRFIEVSATPPGSAE